jgi:hypothetical protein
MAAWRDTRDGEKLAFLCRAIAHLGHPTAFTLRLNLDFATRAKADPEWLVERVKRYVGRETPLVFAFGYENGILHLHGACSAAASDLAKIHTALLGAAGPWSCPWGKERQLV